MRINETMYGPYNAGEESEIVVKADEKYTCIVVRDGIGMGHIHLTPEQVARLRAAL